MKILTWHIWRTDGGDWRVNAKARNGEIVFASSEGYTRRSMAVRNARLFAAPHELAKHETVRTWVETYYTGTAIVKRAVLP
jgi:uncharacterized protein YegP (UPF0339 family)